MNEYMQSDGGQQALETTMSAVETAGQLIPIPGAGIAAEIVSAVLALVLGRKGILFLVNKVKNAEVGKIFGPSKTGE